MVISVDRETAWWSGLRGGRRLGFPGAVGGRPNVGLVAEPEVEGDGGGDEAEDDGPKEAVSPEEVEECREERVLEDAEPDGLRVFAEGDLGFLFEGFFHGGAMVTRPAAMSASVRI